MGDEVWSGVVLTPDEQRVLDETRPHRAEAMSGRLRAGEPLVDWQEHSALVDRLVAVQRPVGPRENTRGEQ